MGRLMQERVAFISDLSAALSLSQHAVEKSPASASPKLFKWAKTGADSRRIQQNYLNEKHKVRRILDAIHLLPTNKGMLTADDTAAVSSWIVFVKYLKAVHSELKNQSSPLAVVMEDMISKSAFPGIFKNGIIVNVAALNRLPKTFFPNNLVKKKLDAAVIMKDVFRHQNRYNFVINGETVKLTDIAKVERISHGAGEYYVVMSGDKVLYDRRESNAQDVQQDAKLAFNAIEGALFCRFPNEKNAIKKMLPFLSQQGMLQQSVEMGSVVTCQALMDSGIQGFDELALEKFETAHDLQTKYMEVGAERSIPIMMTKPDEYKLDIHITDGKVSIVEDFWFETYQSMENDPEEARLLAPIHLAERWQLNFSVGAAEATLVRDDKEGIKFALTSDIPEQVRPQPVTAPVTEPSSPNTKP